MHPCIHHLPYPTAPGAQLKVLAFESRQRGSIGRLFVQKCYPNGKLFCSLAPEGGSKTRIKDPSTPKNYYSRFSSHMCEGCVLFIPNSAESKNQIPKIINFFTCMHSFLPHARHLSHNILHIGYFPNIIREEYISPEFLTIDAETYEHCRD